MLHGSDFDRRHSVVYGSFVWGFHKQVAKYTGHVAGEGGNGVDYCSSEIIVDHVLRLPAQTVLLVEVARRAA